MILLSLLKQCMNTNIRFQLCQKCSKLNSKSFSQLVNQNKLKIPLQSIKSNFKTFPFKCKLNKRFMNTKPDTTEKDIILYQYFNKRRADVVLIFGITQFSLWTFTAYNVLTELRDAPVDEKEGLGFFERNNFGEKKWKYSLGLVCFTLAIISIGVSFIFLSRMVTRIKLDRSGKTLTLFTADTKPWRKTFVVPVKDVSAYYSRSDIKSFFPFQVRGKKIIYIIDMEGKINNQALFDVTVGTKRKLN